MRGGVTESTGVDTYAWDRAGGGGRDKTEVRFVSHWRGVVGVVVGGGSVGNREERAKGQAMPHP